MMIKPTTAIALALCCAAAVRALPTTDTVVPEAASKAPSSLEEKNHNMAALVRSQDSKLKSLSTSKNDKMLKPQSLSQTMTSVCPSGAEYFGWDCDASCLDNEENINKTSGDVALASAWSSMQTSTANKTAHTAWVQISTCTKCVVETATEQHVVADQAECEARADDAGYDYYSFRNDDKTKCLIYDTCNSEQDDPGNAWATYQRLECVTGFELSETDTGGYECTVPTAAPTAAPSYDAAYFADSAILTGNECGEVYTQEECLAIAQNPSLLSGVAGMKDWDDYTVTVTAATSSDQSSLIGNYYSPSGCYLNKGTSYVQYQDADGDNNCSNARPCICKEVDCMASSLGEACENSRTKSWSHGCKSTAVYGSADGGACKAADGSGVCSNGNCVAT